MATTFHAFGSLFSLESHGDKVRVHIMWKGKWLPEYFEYPRDELFGTVLSQLEDWYEDVSTRDSRIDTREHRQEARS